MALPVLWRNREESTPVAWRAPLGQPWPDFGGAAEGAMDADNMLKPVLDKNPADPGKPS